MLKALNLVEEHGNLPKRAAPPELEARVHNYSFKSRSPINLTPMSSIDNFGHMPPRFRLAQSPVNAGQKIGQPTVVTRQNQLSSKTLPAGIGGGLSRAQSQPAFATAGRRAPPPTTIGCPHRVETPSYMKLPPRKRTKPSSLQGLGGSEPEKKEDGNSDKAGLFKRKTLMNIQDCAYRANACRRAGRTKAEANAYITMGIHYDNIAEHLKAARCYMQAIQTLDGVVEDMLVTTLAYNCIAISLYQAGQPYMEQAVKYNQLHLDHASTEGKFSAFTNLGLIFSDMKEATRASDCHKDALRCALKLKSVPKQAIAIGNLGISGFKHQDYATAEACMERHLQLSKTLGDVRGQALSTQILGEIANCKHNFGKATGYFKSSIELSKHARGGRAADGAKVQLGVALAQSRMDAHMENAARFFDTH